MKIGNRGNPGGNQLKSNLTTCEGTQINTCNLIN